MPTGMRYRGILKEYAAIWEILMRTADAFAVLVSGWLASLIYLGTIPQIPGYTLGIVLAVLLCLHLGAVMALFATLPYGKFAHGIFRTASLLRHAIEKRKPNPVGLGAD